MLSAKLPDPQDVHSPRWMEGSIIQLCNSFKSCFVYFTKWNGLFVNELLLILGSNGWRPLAIKMAGSTKIPLWSGGSWWTKVGKGCSWVASVNSWSTARWAATSWRLCFSGDVDWIWNQCVGLLWHHVRHERGGDAEHCGRESRGQDELSGRAKAAGEPHQPPPHGDQQVDQKKTQTLLFLFV